MYLFPLSSSGNKTNDGFGDSSAMRDNGSVVDEFIRAEFQDKEGGDEDGDVVRDGVGVCHFLSKIKKNDA